jgi:hypothetical protein
MLIIYLLYIILLVVLIPNGNSMRYDCCQSKYSSSGLGCLTETVYNNE